MTHSTKFYFECHITLEPVFDERLEEARELCKRFGFRVADLLMVKRQFETQERSKTDTFATARSKSYGDLAYSMVACIRELQAKGFQVWRYKIEDTLLDSKIMDELRLIGERHGT